jgi:hypothetical protein
MANSKAHSSQELRVSSERRKRDRPSLKGTAVVMTAGMLANDIPVLTAEQEREAFERAVAEEVAEEGIEPPDEAT